jgi:ferritin-like metal-binding protein YciE
MKLENLRDLFFQTLMDLYSTETQTMDVFPLIIAKVSDARLKEVLELHVKQTQNQRDRLEEICEKLDLDPDDKFSKAAQGLITEVKDWLIQDAVPEVLDAGIIALVQKLEHYEIAGYGTAKTFASRLEENDVKGLLEITQSEEKEFDLQLTHIAESSVNQKAES